MTSTEGRRPMGRSMGRASLLALGVASTLATSEVMAQAVTSPEVQALLKQRDDAILKLTRRLEQLERRLAAAERARKSESAAAEPPKAAAQPLATAPVPAPAPAPTPPAPTATAAAEPKPEPGSVAVDPLSAERALERTLVETGALLLEPGQAEAQVSMLYQRTDATSSALQIDGGGAAVGTVDQRLERDRFTAEAEFRIGLPFDSQLELSLPYNYVNQGVSNTASLSPINSSSRSGSAFGDLSLGAAKTLWRQNEWLPDVVARLTWDTNSGQKEDSSVALPSGYNEVRGELAAIRRVDPLAFVMSASYQYAFEDDDVKFGDQYGLTVGAILAASPSTSLRTQFETTFGQDIEVDGSRLQGSDFVAASLSLGASMLIVPRVLFDLTGSLGLTDEASDFSLRASLSYRFDTPFR